MIVLQNPRIKKISDHHYLIKGEVYTLSFYPNKKTFYVYGAVSKSSYSTISELIDIIDGKYWNPVSKKILKNRGNYLKYFPVLLKKIKNCWICNVDFKEIPKELITIEHKIPLSKGGSNRLNNLSLSCQDCNTMKSNMLGRDISLFKILRPKSKIKICLKCNKETSKLHYYKEVKSLCTTCYEKNMYLSIEQELIENADLIKIISMIRKPVKYPSHCKKRNRCGWCAGCLEDVRIKSLNVLQLPGLQRFGIHIPRDQKQSKYILKRTQQPENIPKCIVCKCAPVYEEEMCKHCKKQKDEMIIIMRLIKRSCSWCRQKFNLTDQKELRIFNKALNKKISLCESCSKNSLFN